MLIDLFEGRRPGADAVEAYVHGNPVQPRRQRRMPAKRLEAAIRAQEDVLRKVARVFVIVHEPVAEAVHRSPVSFDDQIERAGAPGETRLHQRPVVQSGERRIAIHREGLDRGDHRPRVRPGPRE